MALGSMAKDDESRTDQNFATQWAQPAFSILPTVLIHGSDIMAVQCLLLFRHVTILCEAHDSLYYMWLLKPSHAFNLICNASMKLQHILYSRSQKASSETGVEERELEKRAFWALVIMEK
jgi:amino acid permease